MTADPARTVLVAGSTRAEFVPALGCICCSLEHEGRQLLGLRRGLDAYAEAGSTMGIPLLHPWANRIAQPRYRAAGREVAFDAGLPALHLDGNGLPIHGVLGRELPFRVAGVGATWLDAVLESAECPGLTAVFPYSHRLGLEARLEPGRLELTTTLSAVGRDRVPVAFGYHPYLQLAGTARADWQVAAPVRTRMVLDDRMIPTGETRHAPFQSGPLADRTFDDAYAGVADGSAFILAGGGHRTTVTFIEGYPVAQVFAPPGQDVACFEPMTAPANALVSGASLRVLMPGESHRASFAVGVQ